MPDNILDVKIKKNVAFLHVIEDLEKFMTAVADKLVIDMSNSLNYPALEVSGQFTNPNGIIAYSADKLSTPKKITLAGHCTGSIQFDGSSDVIIETIVVGGMPGPHKHLSVDITDASSNNIANKIVIRDKNGNFSANNITANLIGNVSGTATNAENVTARINNIPLNEIFHTDGKTVKNAINANNAINADNVTTKINNIPLNEIFHTDGKTVKNAINANNADTIDNKHYIDIIDDTIINAVIFG